MQTFIKGYTKVLSSRQYDPELISSKLEPFSQFPLTIEECRLNLDGIQINVCTKNFELSKFLNAVYFHSDKVTTMFTQALALRSLSKSPFKESLIKELEGMIKRENPIDLSSITCDKVVLGVDVKSVVISGKPYIRYSKYPFTLVVPAKINANLSCFVDYVAQRLGNTALRLTVDPYPTIYWNHHAIVTFKEMIADEDLYPKLISFIKSIVDNKELYEKVSSIARQIKEIEDREIYYEFKLKALIEDIEKTLKEIMITFDGTR